MNREDIERMARAAKGHAYTNRYTPGETAFAFSIDRLERFAALIISHHDKANRPKPDASEREWLQQIAYQHGGIGDLSGAEFEFGAMVAAAEREACAAICDTTPPYPFRPSIEAAHAIRARGEE